MLNEKYGIKLGEFNNTTGTERVKSNYFSKTWLFDFVMQIHHEHYLGTKRIHTQDLFWYHESKINAYTYKFPVPNQDDGNSSNAIKNLY